MKSRRLFPTVIPQPGQMTPVLIGFQGPPGGGKTLSALLVGKGIKRVRPGPIKLIDTEAGRSLAYRKVVPFDWVPFEPPFRSDDFEAAIVQAAEENPACIIVDTMSDEHEGIGGMLEWHEEEVDRRLGDDKDNWSRREAMAQAGWIKPKAARRRLINTMRGLRIPLILTFQAREKTKPIKDQRGKTVPTNIGFQPIAPVEIVHAMTLNCFLPPRAEGVPRWQGATAQEDFMMKLPDFLKPLFQEPGPITAEHGEGLARWALGESIAAEGTSVDRIDPRGKLATKLREKAGEGSFALDHAWSMLALRQREAAEFLRPSLDEIAAAADRAVAGDDKQAAA